MTLEQALQNLHFDLAEDGLIVDVRKILRGKHYMDDIPPALAIADALSHHARLIREAALNGQG